MKLYSGKIVAVLLLGNTALVQAQPRSPNAPRPIAPHMLGAFPSKLVGPVHKPAVPAPKPAAPLPKPVLAPVSKPSAPVAKPNPLARKPAALVPTLGCPTIEPYPKPPAAECVKCYKDMGTLATYLNSTSGNVSVSLCNGTNTWPAEVSAVLSSSITSLKLSCCGNANSCIIDGGAPKVTRTKSLITVNSPIKNLDIQGIKFQNIYCMGDKCDSALLALLSTALVNIKHVTINKVAGYSVSS